MRVCLCHSEANKLLLVCRTCISVFYSAPTQLKLIKSFEYLGSMSYFHLHGLVVCFLHYFAPAESLLANNE